LKTEKISEIYNNKAKDDCQHLRVVCIRHKQDRIKTSFY